MILNLPAQNSYAALQHNMNDDKYIKQNENFNYSSNSDGNKSIE